MFEKIDKSVRDSLMIENGKQSELNKALRQTEKEIERLGEIRDIVKNFDYLEKNGKYLYSSQYYSFMDGDANFIYKNGKIVKIDGRNAYLKKWNLYPEEKNNEWKVFIDSEGEAMYGPCPYCLDCHVIIRESVQVYGSSDGRDTWRETFLIICDANFKLFKICETYSYS